MEDQEKRDAAPEQGAPADPGAVPRGEQPAAEVAAPAAPKEPKEKKPPKEKGSKEGKGGKGGKGGKHGKDYALHGSYSFSQNVNCVWNSACERFRSAGVGSVW